MCFAAVRPPSCGVPSVMTDAEIEEMVELHNEERRKYGADQFALVSIQTGFYTDTWALDSDVRVGTTLSSTQLASMDEGVKHHLSVRMYSVTILYDKNYNPLISCTDPSLILVRYKTYLNVPGTKFSAWETSLPRTSRHNDSDRIFCVNRFFNSFSSFLSVTVSSAVWMLAIHFNCPGDFSWH